MVTIDSELDLPAPSTNPGDPDVWGAQYNTAIRKLKTAVDALNTGKVEPGAALIEIIQDAVAAVLVAGSGIGVLYNDTAGTLTLTSTATGGSTDAEVVRDTIGTALAAGANVTLTVDDANDKITIAAANSTDPEVVRDVIGATLVAGAGVSVVVDDAANTITLAATAASSSTDLEAVRDAVGAALVAGAGISVGVDDANDRITITATGSPAAAQTTRTPEQYGAVGDGVTNDQAAWVALLAAVQAGERIYCAPGKVYAHSGKLTTPAVADVTLDMTGARLRATNPAAACFKFHSSAHRWIVRGFVHEVVGATSRNNLNEDSCPLLVDVGNVGIQLWNPRTSGSAGTGMFIYGAIGFLIVNAVVDRSWADGFHMTQGARNGLVINPTVIQPGDDGVAVVSYFADTNQCQDITVIHPVVRHCHARGVSIVGGIDVRYFDIDVAFTRAAGAAIMAEDGADFKTKQNTRCRIRGGRVAHTNYAVQAAGDSGTADGPLDHGALFLFNQRTDAMTDCTITDVEISDIGPGSVYDITRAITFNGGGFTGCSIRRITMKHGLPQTDFLIGGNHAGTVPGADTFIDLRGQFGGGGGAGARAAVKAKLAGDVSAASSSLVTLAWTGADEIDTANLHSTSSNPERLVAATAGVYLVVAAVSYAANTTGNRGLLIRKGGSTALVDEIRNPTTGSLATRMTASVLVTLGVGEWVDCSVFQASGGALAIEAALSFFSMTLVA